MGFKQIFAVNSKGCIGFLKKKGKLTILNEDATSQSVAHWKWGEKSPNQ